MLQWINTNVANICVYSIHVAYCSTNLLYNAWRRNLYIPYNSPSNSPSVPKPPREPTDSAIYGRCNAGISTLYYKRGNLVIFSEMKYCSSCIVSEGSEFSLLVQYEFRTKNQINEFENGQLLIWLTDTYLRVYKKYYAIKYIYKIFKIFLKFENFKNIFIIFFLLAFKRNILYPN